MIQGQGLASGFLSGPSGSTDNVLGDRIPQEPFDVNANASDPFAGMNYGVDALESDPASRNIGLDPSSPGMMGTGASHAQSSDLPDIRTLLPDYPIRSIERHQSIATGSGTNATNSALQTPQQQQFSPLGASNPQPPFPPGYTRAGAVARDDPYGVWYFNPHDTCTIPLGHRHDMDGGVWFTNETSVTMSLLAMQRTEGIGFLLGVASTAELILNLERRRDLGIAGPNIDPRALMRQITQIVNDNLPAEFLDRDSFQVPSVTDIERLRGVNRRLPAGRFYDPFHRRVVQYDMPGHSETQGGGQGGGAASSSRPSRQGSGDPGAGTS